MPIICNLYSEKYNKEVIANKVYKSDKLTTKDCVRFATHSARP